MPDKVWREIGRQPEIVTVTLTEEQFGRAEDVGIRRAESARDHNRVEIYGKATDKDIDIEAPCSELAVAIWTGLPWTGEPVVENPYQQRRLPDVGDDVQVYWTHGIGLIVHPDDPDDQRWILTSGQGKTKNLLGWILCGEAKSIAPFGSDPRKQGHLVRTFRLNPMSLWVIT